MEPRKPLLFLMLVLLTSGDAPSQATFKAGFKTFTIGSIVHEYTYTFNAADSARLTAIDSSKILIATDSAATLAETFNTREKANYKTVHYYNGKRQLVKKEEYKNDNLQEANEWTYDDKNRKATHYRDNKITNTRYRKSYDYSTDKKTGETVITESSYVNNKIEFYTKLYYDKRNVLQKEVRLNDNNKDVIHVESFTYGENGKVKERSVFFPEFKVTKKHHEPAGELPKKCFALLPAGIAEKVTLPKKTIFIKRVLIKNAAVLSDPECKDFEYSFTNGIDCSITVTPAQKAGLKAVKFRFKEKF